MSFSLTYPLSSLIVALLIYIHCSSEDLIHLSFFWRGGGGFCIKTESSKSWMHISLITYIQPKSSMAQLCLGHAVHHGQNRWSPQWLFFLVGGGVSLLSSLSAQVSKIWHGIQTWGYTFFFYFFITFYVSSRSVFFFFLLCRQFALMLYVLFFYCENMLLYQRHRCGLCGRLHASAG